MSEMWRPLRQRWLTQPALLRRSPRPCRVPPHPCLPEDESARLRVASATTRALMSTRPRAVHGEWKEETRLHAEKDSLQREPGQRHRLLRLASLNALRVAFPKKVRVPKLQCQCQIRGEVHAPVNNHTLCIALCDQRMDGLLHRLLNIRSQKAGLR